MSGDWPKRINCYVHSSKEAMWDKGAQLGLSEESLQRFKHALCEIEVALEVYEDGEHIVVEVKYGRTVFRP